MVQVSPDTLSVLHTALTVGSSTDGAFDVSVLPLVEAWGIYIERLPRPG